MMIGGGVQNHAATVVSSHLISRRAVPAGA
jgi:hypothetical protein